MCLVTQPVTARLQERHDGLQCVPGRHPGRQAGSQPGDEGRPLPQFPRVRELKNLRSHSLVYYIFKNLDIVSEYIVTIPNSKYIPNKSLLKERSFILF